MGLGAMTAAGTVELSTTAAGPTTDPTQLLQLAEGMYAIEILAAAVTWLDLFEWLADNPSDAKTIARELELAEQPTHVMLTLLQSLKLVDCNDSRVYALTQLATEYLLQRSPWNVAPVFEALAARPACIEMLQVLRTGTPTSFGADGADDWASCMDDEMFAEMFLSATDSRNAYLAHAVAVELGETGCRRLLDIGGGSGIYSCALVRQNPLLSATVFEKPPVDAVARRAVARRDLTDRVDVLPGDMFRDSLPSGYDAHLYSNIIHDWEEDQVIRLLQSSFTALDAGGRIVVHDALLDADGAGPLAVAEYSVLLMASTTGRCYSLADVSGLLAQAGFTDITHVKTVVERSLVTAVKPR